MIPTAELDSPIGTGRDDRTTDSTQKSTVSTPNQPLDSLAPLPTSIDQPLKVQPPSLPMPSFKQIVISQPGQGGLTGNGPRNKANNVGLHQTYPPVPETNFSARKIPMLATENNTQVESKDQATTTLQFSDHNVKLEQEDASAERGQLDQVAGFWERYNKAADFEDREFVKAAGGNLDTLLIFAGLFSGVNTAFIVESIKTIQPDQTAKTNDLIRSVILVLQNVTTYEDYLHNEKFVPSPQNLRSTVIFFASLCCSLAAASGAVLGKQWLNHYEREGGLKPPPGRGRERQKKYEGRAQWHLEGVIETLPTLLQISLFLFLAALVGFLWPVSQTSGVVVLGFSLLVVCFYWITTVIAAIYPLSPFHTRLSNSLRTGSVTTYHAMFTIANGVLAMGPKIAHVMEYLIDKLPDVLGLFCWTAIFLVLWPPRMIWRFATLVLRSMRSLVCHLFLQGNSQPYTMTTNIILDIKCLIFYAERASTYEELSQLLAGMDALPVGVELSPNHPILTSLGETILKFVIKPNDNHPYNTPLSTNDFKQLLKPLHILYSAWNKLNDPQAHSSSSPYFDKYHFLIWRKLGEVLALDIWNQSSARLIRDVFCSAGFPGRSSTEQNLLASSVAKSDNLLPVRLLAVCMDINADPYPELPQGVDVIGLIPAVLSALEKETINMEGLNNEIWAEVLSDHLGDSTFEVGFSRYLAKSCKSDSSRTVLSCLRGTYKILCRNADSPLWPLAFENEELPALLLQISRWGGSGGHSGLALLCFVFLWHRRRPQGSDTAIQTSLYHAPESVTAIASALGFLEDIKDIHLTGMDGLHISQTMEYVVEYFEEASNLALLKRSMKGHIRRYMAEGYCHRIIEPGLRRDLYTRLAARACGKISR